MIDNYLLTSTVITSCRYVLPCEAEYIWSFRHCKCIPKILSSPSPSCEPKSCQGHGIWNQTICRCECPETEDCVDGYVFDREACSCICQDVTPCEDGSTFDELLCRCVKKIIPKCSEGLYYDESKCKCVCLQEARCINFEIFDENLCKCLCPFFTGPQGRIDEASCSCI